MVDATPAAPSGSLAAPPGFELSARVDVKPAGTSPRELDYVTLSWELRDPTGSVHRGMDTFLMWAQDRRA